MKCKKCGSEINESMECCSFCGTPVPKNMKQKSSSQTKKGTGKAKIVFGVGFVLVLAVATVLAWFFGMNTVEQRISRNLQVGEELLASTDPSDQIKADAAFTKVLELDSKNMDALLGHAQSLNQQGKPEEAAKELEKAEQGLTDTSTLEEKNTSGQLSSASARYNEVSRQTEQLLRESGNTSNADQVRENRSRTNSSLSDFQSGHSSASTGSNGNYGGTNQVPTQNQDTQTNQRGLTPIKKDVTPTKVPRPQDTTENSSGGNKTPNNTEHSSETDDLIKESDEPTMITADAAEETEDLMDQTSSVAQTEDPDEEAEEIDDDTEDPIDPISSVGSSGDFDTEETISAGTNTYLLPDSNIRLYEEDELAELDTSALEMAAREIYARYGLQFASDKVQGYFNSNSWYVAKDIVFEDVVLNTYEEKNVFLICGLLNEMDVAKLIQPLYLNNSWDEEIQETSGEAEDPVEEKTSTSAEFEPDTNTVPPETDTFLDPDFISPDDQMWDDNDSSDETQTATDEPSITDGQVGAVNVEEEEDGSTEDISEDTIVEPAEELSTFDDDMTSIVGIAEENSSEEIQGVSFDPSEYVLFDSDTRLYSREELEGLEPGMIALAMNEILARHGQVFDDDGTQDYFDSKPWYAGIGGLIDPMILNDTEWNNYLTMFEILSPDGEKPTRGTPQETYSADDSEEEEVPANQTINDDIEAGIEEAETIEQAEIGNPSEEIGEEEIQEESWEGDFSPIDGHTLDDLKLTDPDSQEDTEEQVLESDDFLIEEDDDWFEEPDNWLENPDDWLEEAFVWEEEDYEEEDIEANFEEDVEVVLDADIEEAIEIDPGEQVSSSTGYILPDSDKRQYEMDELLHLSQNKLELAAQEILARHGQIFTDERDIEYFRQQPWYHEAQNVVEYEELNEYEQYNYQLLMDALDLLPSGQEEDQEQEVSMAEDDEVWDIYLDMDDSYKDVELELDQDTVVELKPDLDTNTDANDSYEDIEREQYLDMDDSDEDTEWEVFYDMDDSYEDVEWDLYPDEVTPITIVGSNAYEYEPNEAEDMDVDVESYAYDDDYMYEYDYELDDYDFELDEYELDDYNYAYDEYDEYDMDYEPYDLDDGSDSEAVLESYLSSEYGSGRRFHGDEIYYGSTGSLQGFIGGKLLDLNGDGADDLLAIGMDNGRLYMKAYQANGQDVTSMSEYLSVNGDFYIADEYAEYDGTMACFTYWYNGKNYVGLFFQDYTYTDEDWEENFYVSIYEGQGGSLRKVAQSSNMDTAGSDLSAVGLSFDWMDQVNVLVEVFAEKPEGEDYIQISVNTMTTY